ncbi:HEAT repeat domain-containing protein [Emticicia sp. BO119]|uniref:HEAT repeat domain-containing protein n=1 Tax=Emticicia sp. BO119 TaxID=2757768 RepID=UPI0015F0B6BB|nr:HEAT repeat domain-containing protein [Emticicia sp. BO119]MBA4853864.1 HEAT repeat domain-containing protein [Emticicia sp. BO119]
MYQEIEKLLEKYYEGETTLQEEKYIKEFFSKAEVPTHLQHHIAEFAYYRLAAKETPSKNLNEELLRRIEKKGRIIQFRAISMRIAAGVALLIGGFAIGYAYNNRGADIVFVESKTEKAMKQTLQFEQVSLTSASERIDAVNKSLKLKALDQDLIQLLINTLNFDDNINVRLAAAQALAHFEEEPLVREGLIQSLKIQTDPTIQITLIELLVMMKEKRASQTMEQISQDRATMDVVRMKAQEGAAKLITL